MQQVYLIFEKSSCFSQVNQAFTMHSQEKDTVNKGKTSVGQEYQIKGVR